MNWFFIKIKAWKLTLMFALIPVVSLFAGYFWLIKLSGVSSENFGPMFILVFFRAAGVSAIVMATILFSWHWTIAHYLYNLLPDKEGINFKQYKLFLIAGLIFGLIWGVAFFSAYILLLVAAIISHPYLFFIFFGLIILLIIINMLQSFPYKAAKALINEIPYKSVKLESFFFRFYPMTVLQNDVRKVYLKYGKVSF